MFSLFRKISKGIHQNDLVRKYLVYSLGEVLLVMIGILLALQVNNWNEECKLIKEGQDYINELYQDLKKDEENLQRIIDRLNEQLISSEWVLDNYDYKAESNHSFDTLAFTRNLMRSSFPFVVRRANNTYDELKSSGKREIVRDKAFMNQLNEFYFLYDLRVTNFNELPKTARYEHRRLLSQFSNIDDWRHEMRFKKKSPHYFRTVLKNPKVYELLTEIHISSHYNITFFGELKLNATSIIGYIEQVHSDIIHAEE